MMGKLRKDFVFFLWYYIVTLEHGTHFHMHFSTVVFHLSLILVDSMNLLTSLELYKNTHVVSYIGGLVSFSCHTSKSCHAYVQERFGHC